jgi:hypothetical protein
MNCHCITKFVKLTPRWQLQDLGTVRRKLSTLWVRHRRQFELEDCWQKFREREHTFSSLTLARCETWSQVRQHFTRNCFANFYTMKITNTNCTYRKATKTFMYEKDAPKMLVKLRPVVNFINILWAAFAPIFFCQKL